MAKGKAGPSGLNPGAQVTPASDLNHGGQGYRQRQVQGPRTGLSTPAETPVRPAGAGAGESEVERNAQPQVSPDIAEGSSVKPHVAKELPQLQQQPQINAIRTRQAEAQPNSAPLVDPISLHPPPQHRKKAKSPTPLARDDESYGMFSDDDAFYATVDLGDGSGVGLGVGEGGDEGVGGFIDFDEGVGGYESDGEYEVGVREGQQIQAQEQAPPQQNQQPRLAVPTSNSGAGGAVRKQGSSDSVSEWSEQGPTSSMGGFHFPGTAVGSKPAAVSTALGSRPQQGAVQQPQRNAASTGSAGGVMNMLKRSADVMQCVLLLSVQSFCLIFIYLEDSKRGRGQLDGLCRAWVCRIIPQEQGSVGEAV